MIDDRFRYGQAEHAQYERVGYCLFPHFLTSAALEHCRTQVQRMLGELQPGRSPDEIYSAHQLEPWMWELITQPRLLDMIERQIGGSDIVIWSSHLVCKPPRTGRAVPWHQDAPYWNISGRLPGAVWIALDEVGADNGGMAVLPGWHNKGTLKIRNRNESFFNDEIDPSALPGDPDAIKVQYVLPAGGMATHHTMIPHNSIPNKSDRWRRVLVLRYMAADGVMGSKEYPNYRTGELFPRRFFLVRGRDVLGRGLESVPFTTALGRRTQCVESL